MQWLKDLGSLLQDWILHISSSFSPFTQLHVHMGELITCIQPLTAIVWQYYISNKILLPSHKISDFSIRGHVHLMKYYKPSSYISILQSSYCLVTFNYFVDPTTLIFLWLSRGFILTAFNSSIQFFFSVYFYFFKFITAATELYYYIKCINPFLYLWWIKMLFSPFDRRINASMKFISTEHLSCKGMHTHQSRDIALIIICILNYK